MYTADIDWEDFLAAILVGLVFAAIVLGVCGGIIGAEIWFKERPKEIKERNLYLALEGKEIKDQKAIELAEIAKRIYRGEISTKELLGLIEKEKYDLEKMEYQPDSIAFLLANWKKVKGYIENPEKEISVKDSWSEWWFGIFPLISLLVMSICCSINYVLTILEETSARWWQYPWRKWWAYLGLLVVWPYVIVTQPFVLGYAIYQKVKGRREGERREIIERVPEAISEIKSEEEIERSREIFENLVKRIKEKEEEFKEKYVAARKIGLIQGKRKIEEEIVQSKEYLSLLGSQIEEIQRKIGALKREAEELEKAILHPKKEDFEKEFERILNFPLVRAIEVEEEELRVYTETIYINFPGKKYQIGNFVVKIGILEPYIEIHNLTNTSNCGQDHPYGSGRGFCFGTLNESIWNHLDRRDFPVVISLVLRALQTGVGDQQHLIKKWKEVEEGK